MGEQAIGNVNSYALRVEGRPWIDDLTIEQVWAILKAAFQPLEARQELMFMALLPNGEMPSKCLPRSVFDECMGTPAMLANALMQCVQQERGDGTRSPSTPGRPELTSSGLG